MKIETCHIRICNFYSQNPTIDFEAINLLIIDLFEKLSIQDHIATHIKSANAFIQPISSAITDSEERIHTEITGIKDSITDTSKVLDELSDFIGKYRCTSPTAMSDDLECVLNKSYPTARISRNFSEGAFILNHMGSSVYIQNNTQTTNLTENTIADFLKKVKENNTNAILLAQYTGIIDKPNYHIDIYGGHIVLFIHMVNYSIDKIKMGVDIINHLSTKLRELNHTETDYSVSKPMLEDINREYQTFIKQKDMISNTLKDNHKRILTQLDDLRFPVLNQYLSTKFTSTLRPGFKCDICRIFTVNTLKGLAAHKRGCIRKNPVFVGESKENISINI
jgi:hypothetical protein